MFNGFPGGSVVKNPPANLGDIGSIPGSGRSSRRRNGNPLQYSCWKNAMVRGVWWAAVPGGCKESHNQATEHAPTHAKVFKARKAMGWRTENSKKMVTSQDH